MSYVAICKALYDYTAQADDELNLTEDESLYILDNSDPEWWKAKRRPHVDSEGHPQPFPDASLADQVGLVPANYVEEAEPIRMSRALYDYEKQNEDELDIKEDELLRIYEYEGEWLLVKKQGSDELGTGEGKLGFVPANYVDEVAAVDGGPTQVDAAQAQADAEAEDEEDDEDGPSGAIGSAPPMKTVSVQQAAADAGAAGLASGKTDDISMWAVSSLDAKKKKKKGTLGIGNASLFFASESDKTPVQKIGVLSIRNAAVDKGGKTLFLVLDDDVDTALPIDVKGAPNAEEGDKVVAFLASNKSDAEAINKKLQYSKQLARENPKTTAAPTAAASNAGATRSVPPAATTTNGSAAKAAPSSASILPPPQRKNVSFTGTNGSATSAPATPAAAPTLAPGEEHAIALYDFEAQGDDELSVVENEKLIIVERENDDWWKVRNESGQEGVVPASYVEATAAPAAGAAESGAAETDAAAEQAAREEEEELERLRQEEELAAIQAAEAERQRAARAAEMERRKKELVEKKRREEAEAKRREALKAQPAPAVPTTDGRSRDRDAREGKDVKIPSGRSAPERPRETGRSKPSTNNTRIWHDRTGQFKVEAEFLGFNQGKLRLHKLNGVVIEVAIEKMSVPDIQFLEDITGKRLMPGDDDVPLNRAVEQRRRESARASGRSSSGRETEAERERRKQKEKEREARRRQEGRSRRNVDWFEFFLAAGVDMDDCTRYAAAFERDKIDEGILPELEPGILRSLGLREGDIIRVMKLIDRKYKPRTEKSSSSSKEKQIKADEELARKLQEEEQNARRGKTASPAPPQLFSGPDGSLKNNTRRGRPTPSSSSRQNTSVDAASLVAASESLRLNTASPPSRTATVSPESSRKPPNSAVSGFDDDAWTPRPPSVKPATPAIAATPSPAPQAAAAASPPPAAPPAPTPPPAPAAPPAPAPAEPPKPPADPNSALFDKLAAMKPASPAISTGGYDRPGASPMNGSMLGSGSGSFMGARGPLAPVPANQGLLQPLIPTQGTGQFVPTRGGIGMQATGMQPQMTGWGGGMQAQPTGWGGMQPQQTGFNGGMGMQMQPTGFGGQQQFGMQTQPTGFGGFPQQQQQQQPQSTFGMLSAQAQKEEKEKDMTPSNIFAQMKSGSFAKDDDNSAAQPADKYDALRGFQSGGIVAQPTGFQYPQQTGFGGYQYPQQTGYPGGYGYQ